MLKRHKSIAALGSLHLFFPFLLCLAASPYQVRAQNLHFLSTADKPASVDKYYSVDLLEAAPPTSLQDTPICILLSVQ